MHPHLAAASSGKFVELDVEAWHWAGLLGLILGLLAVDLCSTAATTSPPRSGRSSSRARGSRAGSRSPVVVLAMLGGQAFGEYLSGYVIEKSLSVDNVFVWAVIFSTFAIPLRYQHRVLFWGIFGALVLRAVFIFAGTALIEQFWWLLLVFGAMLIVSGIKVVAPPRRRGRARPRPRRVKLLGALPPRAQRSSRASTSSPRGGQVGGHAAARRARRGRGHRRGLRGRQRARDPRGVARAVHRVLVERVRDPRAPRAVLPARRRARALPLPVARAGAILVFVGIKMVVSHWWHMPTHRLARRDRRRSSARRSCSASARPAARPWRPDHTQRRWVSGWSWSGTCASRASRTRS